MTNQFHTQTKFSLKTTQETSTEHTTQQCVPICGHLPTNFASVFLQNSKKPSTGNPPKFFKEILWLAVILTLVISPVRSDLTPPKNKFPTFMCERALSCEKGTQPSSNNCYCVCVLAPDCASGFVLSFNGCGCFCNLNCNKGQSLDAQRCICLGVSDEIKEIRAQTNEMNDLELFFDEEEDEDDEDYR